MCGLNLECWQAFFNFDFWQSFVSNLLATIIGVGLGIPTGLFLNRVIEKRTEKERKEKILKALRGEINQNWILVKIFLDEHKSSDEYFNLSIDLRDEIWRSFSDGGELKWIKNSDLLALLADMYFVTRAIKNSADKYFESSMCVGNQATIYNDVLRLIIQEWLGEFRNKLYGIFKNIDANL